MKSLFFLAALLCICLSISCVSAQVGNSKLQLLVEYFLPYWRQHRARLRPFVFAQPTPVWRVARSAENMMMNGDMMQPPVADQQPSEFVGCLYYKSELLCEKIQDNQRTFQSVQCPVRKHFSNPILENFVSFSIGARRENETSVRFNLFPKKPVNMDITPSQLKTTHQLSLHWINSNDEGFMFDDADCWTQINDLFMSVKPTVVKVKKFNTDNQMARGTENIIGNLISIDFGF